MLWYVGGGKGTWVFRCFFEKDVVNKMRLLEMNGLCGRQEV